MWKQWRKKLSPNTDLLRNGNVTVLRAYCDHTLTLTAIRMNKACEYFVKF